MDYPSYISDTARSFIQGLLDTNEKTRIGCDENGIDGLKMHMFFNGLDWITMQQCHLEAPYVPHVPPPKEKPAYKNYDDMMKAIDKDELEELGIEEIGEKWGGEGGVGERSKPRSEATSYVFLLNNNSNTQARYARFSSQTGPKSQHPKNRNSSNHGTSSPPTP